MYIQITNKCNMSCSHCAFSCGAKGQSMTMKTFKNALKYCDEENITLGGGEPTIHPKFWEFIGLGLSVGEIWLATNGSITETALRLCVMAKRGVIGCALSMDEWHDPIDQVVVDAFQDGMTRDSPRYSDQGYHPNRGSGTGNQNDRREIRDVSFNVSKRGRAIESGVWHKDECTCPGLMCRPNGDMYPCGCSDAPKIGNVNDDEVDMSILEDEAYRDSECSRDIGKCEVAV